MLGLFPQQLLYLSRLQREATTLSPTRGNKFSMSYSLSCCAWEPSPRPVPWLHSYLSSQVVPICTQTLLVLTFALEPYPVIVLGLLLITLTAQNLGFGVTHLQKGVGAGVRMVLSFQTYIKQGWGLPSLLHSSQPSTDHQGRINTPIQGPHTQSHQGLLKLFIDEQGRGGGENREERREVRWPSRALLPRHAGQRFWQYHLGRL